MDSRRMRAAICTLAVLLPAAGCRDHAPPQTRVGSDGAATQPLRDVTLLLNWFPEVEHGGYFAALVHGYYEQEGLRVRILSGGPGASVVPRVATGAVDFGVENADHVVLARAQDAPVVALMAPIHVHPRCIMVHEETGIADLHHLRGLTLAMNAGGAFSHYLKRHVPLDGVTVVPYAGNVSQFLADKSVGQQAYVFSEPYTARKAGANPRTLLLSDIGFNPYTSCLLASERMIAEQPDLVRAMVRASIRGWRQYMEDPKAAHARIIEANPQMDADVLEFGWQALRPLVLDDAAREHGIGHMTPQRWRTLHDQLVEIELIPPGRVDPARCFSADFLPGKVPMPPRQRQ